jgi:hypothetical protein
MRTVKPILYEIKYDCKNKDFLSKIMHWSTVILNEWMANHATKNELKSFSSILIKISFNRSKQFWGSLSDDVENKKSRNKIFYLVLDKRSRILNTLPLYFILSHELAHAIDFIKRNESWHDDYWKEICSQIGAQPDTTIETKKMLIAAKDFPKEYQLAKKIIKKYNY